MTKPGTQQPRVTPTWAVYGWVMTLGAFLIWGDVRLTAIAATAWALFFVIYRSPALAVASVLLAGCVSLTNFAITGDWY